MEQTRRTLSGRTTFAAVIASIWLAGAAGGLVAETTGVGENDPAARFRGPLTYDFGVTNVKREAATKEYSYVTFDLYWSHSWRAKWTEPAETSATGKDMAIENWDAAWVFVKFLPEKDSEHAIERNHWLHATLSTAPAHHVMPSGATNSVKLSDDGNRGMGLFIYRDAVGHGRNDWKGVKLLWAHGDKVDPAKAAVKVHAIAMVYVPEGPFKVGIVGKSGISPFSDGADVTITRHDGEQDFKEVPEVLRKAIETTTSKDGGPYLQWQDGPTGKLTDGGWRGGPTIPFLLDAEWNAPVASGLRARRVGPVAGQLWCTLTFSERGGGGGRFGSQIGGATPLSDEYPTGYEAFYCMKYVLTQGRYADFLNSLPPDVAAGRAFIGSEVSSDAGMASRSVNLDLGPGRDPFTVIENGGHTIYSSADVPESAPKPATGAGLDEEERDAMDDLLEETFSEKKAQAAIRPRPVYVARCPFRRIPGVTGADTRAYAVWAGLRPMTRLENIKAGVGARDPAAPPEWAPPKNLNGPMRVLDEGLPTERYLSGNSNYGNNLALRVGCRATPTSDRGEAVATYWGISELGGPAVGLEFRQFRGTHGNGATSAGKPGASFKRVIAPFKDAPADWPDWGAYIGGHFVGGTCRLVASADNRIKKPANEVVMPEFKRKRGAQFPPADASRDDIPRVANVKLEPGKEYSTVSFDLSWKNAWRAKWQEPADKNVTGKPLTVESWDAAWVFVKFRPTGAVDEVPAMLAAAKKDHQVPAGAELDVGLTYDGSYSAGVFIYRNEVGTGANDFRNVKLRWKHPPSFAAADPGAASPPTPAGSGVTSGEAVDPAKGEVKVYAIAMVYIPEGPFATRSPWGHPLAIITTDDATQPGGYMDAGTNAIPRNPEWPNGYQSFYCMKYSISQGQYADMLNSTPSGKFPVARRHGHLAHNNARRWHPAYYGFNGYTINTNVAGLFHADVPDRMCPLLTEANITFFTVWAGLRLMTSLEYEKACRGPRAVAMGAAAWTQETCGPAAGLDKSVLEAPSAIGTGPSYWGIRELSLSGCVQEWPSVVMSVWGWGGKDYLGTHATGAMADPGDWPCCWFADFYYGGIWRGPGYGTVGHWVSIDECDITPWETMDGERCGRYGVRAVRTAVPAEKGDGPLSIEELPILSGADVAMFNIRGTFRNDSGKQLKVELTTPLPAACYPRGAASRAFTASPKAVTPFKVPVMLTSANAKAAVYRGRFLPVQIRGADGEVLAAASRLRLQMATAARPPVIQSLEGGKIELKVKNATENRLTVVCEMPALPAVKIGKSKQNVSVAAGADGTAAFPVPRQAFPQEGALRIPYRLSLGSGGELAGEATVDLRMQTRWWVTKRVKAGPKAGGADALLGGMEEIAGFDEISGGESAVFKAPGPPDGWKRMTCGGALAFGEDGTLPSHGSTMVGATHVETPSEREAVLSLRHRQATQAASRFLLRVWFNHSLVYEAKPRTAPDAPAEKPTAKPFRMRKGRNTMVVECQSQEDGAATPGAISVEFRDPKSGAKQTDLIFDMGRGK